MLIGRDMEFERWIVKALILILSTSSVVALDREYDMDRLSTCDQEVTVFDFSIILNGRSNAAPANPPTKCSFFIKSGYTDGQNRLQVKIDSIKIHDCAVFVDVIEGRGIHGMLLRSLGCNSKNMDSLYSEKEWITVRLRRPTILYQTAYIFTLTIKTYEDPTDPGILIGRTLLPPAAIIGIIVGLMVIIIVAIILIWCWKSGRIYDYIGWNPNDKAKDNLKSKEKPFADGEDNIAIEKSETTSVKSGIDHRDPSVWSTITNGKYDPNAVRRTDGPQYLGRNVYRNPRPRVFDNRDQNGILLTTNDNAENTAGWQKQQTDLKQLLNNEIRQGRGSTVLGQGSSERGRNENLVDDVFESNDKIARNASHGGDDAYEPAQTTRYLKKQDSNEAFKRGDPTRGSKRNREDGSPNRGSLRRGDRNMDSNRSTGSHREEGSPNRGSLRRGDNRDSNRSTGSHKDDQNKARTLAEEATNVKLRSSKSRSAPDDRTGEGSQVDPLSDFDSSSFMSVPEPAVITAAIHGPGAEHGVQEGQNDESSDSELREINARAKHGDTDVLPNPNISQGHSKKSQQSPNSKQRRKKSPKKAAVPEDVLPPEAFEPLFDRPVTEEPYPVGMQPLNNGYNPYGVPGGMYQMPGYGMPYGMMPAPGTVPPGTQTYAYAYQTMPGPGMAPQAGQAAYYVQETPSKNGPVKKTAFMMATTEPRPEDNYQQGYSDNPGSPSYSSTPYGESPHRQGSGRQKSKPGNPISVIPAGALPPDNGQGHRTAMMKSGVDPNTGIETNQVLWTDTTRDPSDPPPGANPQITRKTVIRTTTRSGHGELPENTDEITDHLYLQSKPNDPSFLSPSRGGPLLLSSNETPDRDNLSYYLGLQHRRDHPVSPQHVIHPAPSRNKAIKDSISIS